MTEKAALPSPEVSDINTLSMLVLSSQLSSSQFLTPDHGTAQACRRILAHVYSSQNVLQESPTVALGPLQRIHVSPSFAYDQVWHQLELRSKPLLTSLQRRISVVRNNSEKKQLDDVTRRRARQTILPHDPQDNQQGGSNPHKDRKKVTFDPKLPTAPTRSLPHRMRDTTNQPDDCFFNVHDMEAFADEAEDMSKEGLPITSGDDDDDYSEGSNDGEGTSGPDEYNDESGQSRSPTSASGILYSDFFDPPDNSRQPEPPTHSDSTPPSVVQEDSDGSDPEEQNVTTPLQRQLIGKRKRIEALEEANVNPRPWVLSGEVDASSRPKDSLLDATTQHDIAAAPKSFVPTEVSEAIEGIIKQRIADGLFDDLVLAMPEDYQAAGSKKGSERELPDVSQEKPTEGLADLYAREFSEQKASHLAKQTASQTILKEDEELETEEQREVNKLFGKLAAKLDALSNLHFTPGLDVDRNETVVQNNVKSLEAEEALPEAVSGDMQLAPQEVFSANKKDRKGEKELTKSERKAKRRSAKARSKKAKEAGTSRGKRVSALDPIAADTRRADVALDKRKKVRNGPAMQILKDGKKVAMDSDEGNKGAGQHASQLAL